ncbi:MAG: cysteine protease, partial [Methanosarcinaceae archaeon]|nr:cysteine protease [Methanosarcinaceae archaeon]
GQAGNDGKIPYPCPGEKIAGGHAVVAVGYNNKMKIKNTICGKETTGAILLRNSWGAGWGDNGYGWLPYDYVLDGLAIDWWTVLKSEWVDTGQFKL